MPYQEPRCIIRCTTCWYHQLWSKEAAESKMEEKGEKKASGGLSRQWDKWEKFSVPSKNILKECYEIELLLHQGEEKSKGHLVNISKKSWL